MKNEVAFVLDPGCKLAQQYMASWDQKKKFRDLAGKFFKKWFNTDHYRYTMSETLRCDKCEPGQTCKEKQNGLFKYKKNSPLQKAWSAEVVAPVDMDTMTRYEFWWFGCIYRGSYSLWQNDGTVYGYLSSKEGSEPPKLPEGATEIKISEYYRVIEEMEAGRDG